MKTQNTLKSKKPFAETKSFSSRLKDETTKPRYELQIRNLEVLEI